MESLPTFQGSRLDVHPLGGHQRLLDALGDVEDRATFREVLAGSVDQDLATTRDGDVATEVGQDDTALVSDDESGHDHGSAFQGWGDETEYMNQKQLSRTCFLQSHY